MHMSRLCYPDAYYEVAINVHRENSSISHRIEIPFSAFHTCVSEVVGVKLIGYIITSRVLLI